MPAKISYAIQNNFFILLEKFELIEKNRVGIGKKYGVLSEDKTSYKIPEDKIEEAQKELDDLLEVEQKVDLIILPLKDIEKCSMSMQQIQAIYFMVDKDSYSEE